MGEIGNRIRVNTKSNPMLASPSNGVMRGTSLAMTKGKGKKKGLFK